MKRRSFMQGAGALVLSASSMASFATTLVRAKPKVVVIGGGFAGAAVAKHLRVHSLEQIDVTVVEPRAEFICTPMSNLVVGGVREINALTFSYHDLEQHYGIRWIQGRATTIDAAQRTVTLADGTQLPYDRLIVSPGIDFMWEELSGIDADARQSVLHAWKGDAQMQQLFAQIEAMHDGGRFIISIPQAPLRCPPAPYERACLVADYLMREKNGCKVVILDANADVLTQAKQFKQVWSQRYADVIEYRPNFTTAEVHAASGTVVSDFGDKVQGAVLNVIPPQRAGDIALQAGLANINRRWCEVDFLSFESTQAKHIHVLGDAIQIAPQMPKAAQMASQQARVCAAAIINMFDDKEPDSDPTLTSTCYSFVSGHQAMHLRSRHRYDAQEKTFLSVASEFAATQPSSSDADEAETWLRTLVADCLA
jgi:NADPH-dependent 2,4-dienoyl-CoA reductase/sulfur reductase-like enzyme